MNPSLLLCLIVCPLAFGGAISLFHFKIVFGALLFTAIGFWPLGICGWQLIRFTLKDPDRLQREQHVENMLQIKSHLSVKDGGEIRQIPITGELVGNPQLGNNADE